ncbi:MAG: SDR family NAD(P)-dependent oxidoreductase [Maricaulaceae bacterium]|nr:SDR family NAD(P)-dependent oxidoreductase [Maricaulaceae bacterium]
MQGKVIAITGAFGVLGSAVAKAAAAADAKTALIDYAEAPSASLKSALGDEALFLGGVDLTDESAAKAVIDKAASHFGRLDALLNIAGGFRWETLEGGAIASWDTLYAMNVKTAACASKAALPHLKASGAGAIVNVGAAGAVKAGAGMGAYAASKSGVMRLTEALAEEWKGKGVRVNAVMPSIIDTPQNRKDMPGSDPKKWVSPDDLAAVMLFLASDAARAVTGALVPVTGEV